MPKIEPNIEPSWKDLLFEEFSMEYFANIKLYLSKEKQRGKIIFPLGPKIFNAFNLCSVQNTKVVILGQDPYHGYGQAPYDQIPQAHGLSFSVEEGIKAPPSLLNIYKELSQEFNQPIPPSGNLEAWARQGVLLLNASLTVEAHQANSHAHIGWHQFTDAVIAKLSQEKENLVFLLWGGFARKKKALIKGNHLVLEAPHPSPLSAHRGFFGCGHFRRCNEWLNEKGLGEITWL